MRHNGNRKSGVHVAAALMLGAVLAAGEGAIAQTRSEAPEPHNSKPLHGVRSKGPRVTHPQTGGGLPINRRNTLLPQHDRPATERPRQPSRTQRPIRRAPNGDVVITRPDGVQIRRPGGGVALNGSRGVVSDGAIVSFGQGGFAVGGAFDDDDSSVVFRSGSGLGTRQPHFGMHGRRHHHHGASVCDPRIGFPLGFFDWWDRDYGAPALYYAGYADPFAAGAPTYAQQVAAQQAAAAAAEAAQPPQLTELEQADLALALGDAEEAVLRYQAYADTHEESAEVVRSLALALFESGRIEESAATMALAYERDPALASSPVEASALEGDESEMGDRVQRAVRFAHKVETSSAWLTVAVLMQAQERNRVAMTMADRAKDAGLSEPVYNAFRAALGG